MKVEMNVYHHHLIHEKDEIIKKLDEILYRIKDIRRKEEAMSLELDALEAAITENTDLDASIIELINGLAAQIVALKEDPVKLAALAATMKASTATIVEALRANTPEPPPVE